MNTAKDGTSIQTVIILTPIRFSSCFPFVSLLVAIISLFLKNQKKDRMYQEEKTVEWDSPIPYF